MDSWVRTSVADGVMHIELNRPEAINALDLQMTLAVHQALQLAAATDEVRAVLLTGVGERGLCAGGDVRAIRQLVLDGHVGDAINFFTHEYDLNRLIAAFEKPMLVIMHGVVMGGGVGISAHANLRVVTDGSRVAMPETRIGFTPDIGGSWLLGKAPGRVGERLALHGATMGPAEAIAAGFADAYVPAEHLAEMVDAFRQAVQDTMTSGPNGAPPKVRTAVAEFARHAGEVNWGLPLPMIDDFYSAPSVQDIIWRLETVAPDDAEDLRSLSPTSLEITLRSVRHSRSLSLDEALKSEHRLVSWLLSEWPDTAEGIRAALVDKDRSPKWKPLAKQLPI